MNPTAFATNWQNNVPDIFWNDIYLDESGNLATVTGVDDLQQTITQSLLLWKGEYDFNINIGVPYNLILGNPQIQNSLIRLYLQTVILTCNNYLTPTQLAAYGINTTGSNSGIVSITFDFTQTTRTQQVNIIVLLNNGTQIPINI